MNIHLVQKHQQSPKSELTLEKFSKARKKRIGMKSISSSAFLLPQGAPRNAVSKIHLLSGRLIKHHVRIHAPPRSFHLWVSLKGNNKQMMLIEAKMTHSILMPWTFSRHTFVGRVIFRSPLLTFLDFPLPSTCICYFKTKVSLLLGQAFGIHEWGGHAFLRGDSSWPYGPLSGSACLWEGRTDVP